MNISNVEKRMSFNEETKRWCCAMFAEGFWTGGFFGDSQEEAERKATECLNTNVNSIRALEKQKKTEIISNINI